MLRKEPGREGSSCRGDPTCANDHGTPMANERRTAATSTNTITHEEGHDDTAARDDKNGNLHRKSIIRKFSQKLTEIVCNCV